jgi:cyclophilin family peptidyl-prolyl cis-trans isomerase
MPRFSFNLRLISAGVILLTLSGLWSGTASGRSRAGLAEGIYARINTTRDPILIRLYYRQAPLAVAGFLGLARGDISWQGPHQGKKAKVPYFDGRFFHEVIPNLLVQGGAERAGGHGGPEILLDHEIDPSLSHNRAGMVSLLNEGASARADRFLITLAPAPFLDGRHTIFGEVASGMENLKRIRKGDRITRVTVIRQGEDAGGFEVGPLLERLLERAAVLSAEQKNAALAAALKGRDRDCRKHLPEPAGAPDPDRVPTSGQPETEQVALEYILVTYKGALTPQVYQCYEQEEARLVAGRIAELARRPGSDFAELSRKYSDAPEYKIPLLLRGKEHPDSVAPVFRLKVGQVSDPLLTAKGYMTFRRVELRLIRVSHILLAYQGASESRQSRTKDEARALAAEILKRARAGEDFSALARQFSDSESAAKGGEIGEIARGTTHPAFDHAAFLLQTGEISEIIPTPAGFQIIRRLE